MTVNAHDVTERSKAILLRLVLRGRRRGQPIDITDVPLRRRAWRAARRIEERRAARGDTSPFLNMPNKAFGRIDAVRVHQHHGWRIVVGRIGGKWHAQAEKGAHPRLGLVARSSQRVKAFRAVLKLIDGRTKEALRTE